MSRLVPILCTACAVAVGLTAWSQLSANDTTVEIPTTTEPATKAPDSNTSTDPREPLRKARMQCSVAALDKVVDQLKQTAESKPKDSLTFRLLAEAHLERAQQRTHLLGMAVGKPTFSELPKDFAADLDAGLAAAKKAHELGDDTGELHRIEAGLMGQHITGLGSALKWNGKIGDALEEAGKRTNDDPALHVAHGLRKLLAPRFFGHDPVKALEHFEFAAKAKGDSDERPAVFAAMATYLQKKRQLAIEWLERAVKTNPNNKFARVVLVRLRRGEEDPFGRDVTEAEVTATAPNK